MKALIARFQRWLRRRKLVKQGIDPDRLLSRQERRRMQQEFEKAIRRHGLA